MTIEVKGHAIIITGNIKTLEDSNDIAIALQDAGTYAIKLVDTISVTSRVVATLKVLNAYLLVGNEKVATLLKALGVKCTLLRTS